MHLDVINVSERIDAPGHWQVETIRHSDDGQVLIACFSGPEAEARALDYATVTFGFPAPSTKI